MDRAASGQISLRENVGEKLVAPSLAVDRVNNNGPNLAHPGGGSILQFRMVVTLPCFVGGKQCILLLASLDLLTRHLGNELASSLLPYQLVNIRQDINRQNDLCSLAQIPLHTKSVTSLHASRGRINRHFLDAYRGVPDKAMRPYQSMPSGDELRGFHEFNWRCPIVGIFAGMILVA